MNTNQHQHREERLIERYAYCLCLHVRPGTIFIGVINLAGSLLCALLFMVALGYHQSHDEISYRSYGYEGPHRRTSQSSLAVVIYMMCATVSGMLLYGVVKSRPSYLMPFFWLQLCDFFFSLPTFLTSLYATPGTYSHWDYGSGNNSPNPAVNAHVLDVKRIWPNANSATIYTSSLLFSAAVLLFKGYFLCVVWKCYRYLKMKEMILPLHLPYSATVGNNASADLILPSGFASTIPQPPPEAFVAPPDYETAMATSAKFDISPPPYSAAAEKDQEPDSSGGARQAAAGPANSAVEAVVVSTQQDVSSTVPMPRMV